MAETFFLSEACFFGEACFLRDAFFLLSLLSLRLCQSPLTSFLSGQGTDAFVDGVLVFAPVAGQDGFAHLDEFLFQQIWNFFFGVHQEPFNVLNFELALVTVEVLAEHGVELSLFCRNGPV